MYKYIPVHTHTHTYIHTYMNTHIGLSLEHLNLLSRCL